MADTDPHPKRASGTDLSGRQLGDYHVLRRLGRGAMAEVYLAEQISLGRQVALKVLKAELASDATYVQRFQREAQAAASLVHANIVQIHEVACIDGCHLIAQEYVAGANLQQFLARNGTLDVQLALLVLRQSAAALAKAAEQQIVHRDIKPENILLTKSGEVKVADFGLARVLQNDGAVQLTQVGMTMGTPLYMSPEQAEGKPLDHRSDIYSLGVACYSMIAGHPPFSGDTALSVAVQHLKRQPEPLENIRPDLPPGLARIIHKMMAKSPDHRHQTARELIRELRPLIKEYLDDEVLDVPGVETADVDLLATSRHAATQRLGVAMKSSAESRASRLRWALYATAAVAAFVVGGLVAQATIVEPPLLSREDLPSQRVEDKGSAWLQLHYAKMTGTEEAWLSVIEYYPKDEFCVAEAQQNLALIYMRDAYEFRMPTDKADAVLQELALASNLEPEIRAFSLAGQYCLLTHRKEFDQAAAFFSEHRDGLRHLADPSMRRWFEAAASRYGRSGARELLAALPAPDEEPENIFEAPDAD